MPKDLFNVGVDTTAINRFMLVSQYAGPSYDAGILAGRTAGEQGQDPPVAVDISALVDKNMYKAGLRVREARR